MVGLTPEGGWDRPAQVILDEARRNLERFDHVGFVETFNEDVQSIFVDLGSPGVATRKSNSVPCKSIYADLPRRTKARLREVTRLDRALYVHAVRTYAGDRLTLRLRDRLLSGVTKWSNGRLG